MTLRRCRVQAPPPLPWPLRLLLSLAATIAVAWLLLSTWAHWQQVRSWERTGPVPAASAASTGAGDVRVR